MKRTIVLIACCLWLAACGGGSGGGDGSAAVPASPSDELNGFNPAALSVESPPTDGKLPADLFPPA